MLTKSEGRKKSGNSCILRCDNGNCIKTEKEISVETGLRVQHIQWSEMIGTEISRTYFIVCKICRDARPGVSTV
jgi:hypothetical protein